MRKSKLLSAKSKILEAGEREKLFLRLFETFHLKKMHRFSSERYKENKEVKILESYRSK